MINALCLTYRTVPSDSLHLFHVRRLRYITTAAVQILYFVVITRGSSELGPAKT